MSHNLRKGDMEHDDKVVQEFILVLLKEWGQELDDRDKEAKMSLKGKMEATTYAQTRYVFIRLCMPPVLTLIKI